MKKRILAALVAIAALASADTITLRNGSKFDGTFLGGDNRSVRFAVGNQVNTYYLTDIESIRFSSGAAGASAYAGPGPANYPQAQNYPTAPYPPGAYPPAPAYPPSAPGPYSAPAAPQAPVAPLAPMAPDAGPAPASGPETASMGIEVPAGTQIVVRLIDSVDSDRDRLGQSFRASLDQPVVVNGQTVIPRGAEATAKLIDAQQSGKIEGRTTLTLDLKTILANGRSYDTVTTGVVEASSSRGQRSAKVIGGATALGALIGGIAGGGRGAAIGAGSGAAVGTAAQVVTSGQHVRIPSETRLTFTLQNPLDL
jgi:hypothetical protein